MILYGGALLPNDEMQIIDNFAALGDEYGESLLGISVTEDEAIYVLDLAITTVDGAYKQEIDKTINFVKNEKAPELDHLFLVFFACLNEY